MREVEKFLSSEASQDELELRDMLRFVLGLLRCYVEMAERRASMQLASVLSNVDPQDLTRA